MDLIVVLLKVIIWGNVGIFTLLLWIFVHARMKNSHSEVTQEWLATWVFLFFFCQANTFRGQQCVDNHAGQARWCDSEASKAFCVKVEGASWNNTQNALLSPVSKRNLLPDARLFWRAEAYLHTICIFMSAFRSHPMTHPILATAVLHPKRMIQVPPIWSGNRPRAGCCIKWWSLLRWEVKRLLFVALRRTTFTVSDTTVRRTSESSRESNLRYLASFSLKAFISVVEDRSECPGLLSTSNAFDRITLSLWWCDTINNQELSSRGKKTKN